jgi:hypothetical protein
MKRHVLTNPLAATLLLLSTLGCAKKEEAKPTTNTASYQLDNVTINCQATASTNTTTSNGITLEYLTVDLVTTPQPSAGAETLRLYYVKPAQSATTYVLNAISLKDKGNTQPYFFSVDMGALNVLSGGGYSGAFSGKVLTSSGAPAAPYATIANGTFTNVRL